MAGCFRVLQDLQDWGPIPGTERVDFQGPQEKKEMGWYLSAFSSHRPTIESCPAGWDAQGKASSLVQDSPVLVSVGNFAFP